MIEVPTLNHLRSSNRDTDANCLNVSAIRTFSNDLSNIIKPVIDRKQFAFVLGGDCSILLGVMPGLKAKGNYGLLFIDAHADFYAPGQSTTGEVADMDLAIVTGRGPDLLTNMDHLRPYVLDKNVVHIAQRDEQQAAEYGSDDIRDTAITYFGLNDIRTGGIKPVIEKILHHVDSLDVNGFWIHFDTDALDDGINPAVDYRLPGGLKFDEASLLINKLLTTDRIAGISVTIYNANLDPDSHVAKGITDCLATAFRL